jgi:D-tyrosyl-tRNA(Tyr) deacylase
LRAVIQRVKRASVTIGGIIKSEIGPGLLILAGIEETDDNTDTDWLAAKIIQLRIFDDENGVMNLPVTEAGGNIMVISQFTLHAKTKKGNRPSYIRAARPETAVPLYNRFIDQLAGLLGKNIATGEFGAMMEVELINNGPVTIIIDTKNKE